MAWWLAVAVASQPTRVRESGRSRGVASDPRSEAEWGWRKSLNLKKTRKDRSVWF
jgi:hypothetical protein